GFDTNNNTNIFAGYQQTAPDQSERYYRRNSCILNQLRTMANDGERSLGALAGLEPARCFHHLILSQYTVSV
ncbi:MAG TPA: hypothetical protein VI756_06005, partial [Blastocatellia bacterium]